MENEMFVSDSNITYFFPIISARSAAWDDPAENISAPLDTVSAPLAPPSATVI